MIASPVAPRRWPATLTPVRARRSRARASSASRRYLYSRNCSLTKCVTRCCRRKHAPDPAANRTRRLDQTSSPVTQIHRPARLATRAASFRYGGRHHRTRVALSRYTRATSSAFARPHRGARLLRQMRCAHPSSAGYCHSPTSTVGRTVTENCIHRARHRSPRIAALAPSLPFSAPGLGVDRKP